MKTKSLSLDIETLVELTPEDQKSVNGGLLTSSAIQPTSSVFHPQPVSSAKPPAKPKHHHKHQTVSSVMPTPPVHP